jgi:cell division protein FtsQ
VLLGGVLAVLVALAWGVSVSPLLDVDQVTVRGASRLDQEEIEAAAGVHVGDALLWMDPGAAVEGIEALPYVRSATAAREWPDAVRITVRERAPVAWVDAPGGKKAVVDRTGRVLEEVDTPPGLPQLVGVRVVPPAGGTIDAAGAARVAGGLEGLARLATQSVEATDHGVVVHLVRGAEIRMGPPTQVAVKLRAAFAVLAASEGHPLTYVDVSTPIIPVTD